ncbi:MAG: fibronectin type III domain-containing protein [Uliginosibacterium sp.]|nr:fibronectin type III domain-containing protein [Uliginosibacterium sp.]
MFDTRRRYALSLSLCVVLALPGCGGGGSDAAGTTAPQGATTTDSTPPSPPGTLTLLSLTGDSVRLSWGAASDDAGVTGYDILRNAQVVGSTSGEVLSFTDTGLVRGKAYTYTVRARDAAGNWSAPSVGLVATPGSGVVADTQAPSVPTGLKLDGATQNSLSLSWQASSDNLAVTRYELYRDGALLTTLSANTRSYVNTGLSAVTSYRYAVLARDAAGNASALSASLSAATLGQVAQDVQAPTAPTGLTVSSVGAKRADAELAGRQR